MQAAVLDIGLSFAERSQRAGSPTAAALQRTRAILGARMAQAESQAQGFGQAAAVESRGVWQWIAAAAAVLALSGAGFLYCKEAVAPHVTEPATAVLAIGAAGSGIGANPFAVPRAVASQPTPSAATITVKREGDAIVIALRDAPLAAAVAALADVTQTSVVGQAPDTRISLEWRGRAATAAWQALLAAESGYALACDLPDTTASCRVWLATSHAAVTAQ